MKPDSGKTLAHRTTSGFVCRALEDVEDKVEAVFELAAVVVAGLQDVPDRQFGEVGVVARRELAKICCATCAVVSGVSKASRDFAPGHESAVDPFAVIIGQLKVLADGHAAA